LVAAVLRCDAGPASGGACVDDRGHLSRRRRRRTGPAGWPGVRVCRVPRPARSARPPRDLRWRNDPLGCWIPRPSQD